MKSLNIFLLLLPCWLVAQTSVDLPPGECFETCYIPDVYKIHEIELPVFTGNPNDQVVERYWRTIQTETGEEKQVMVVKDLYKIDSYELQTFKMRVLVKKGDYEEERAILCEEQLTSQILLKVQESLMLGDYLPKGYQACEDFKPEILNALIDYQKANGLPIGHFDFETLENLGIEF